MHRPQPLRSVRIPAHPSTPVLVAIVGGSGSGKTWLTNTLQAAFGNQSARLSLDDFYRDRSHLTDARRAKLNFDHPRAIDWESFENVLRALLSGKAAQLPCYDFKTHCRLRESKLMQPRPFILVDGLWLLRRPRIRKLFALSIFLDCPTKTRLQRRLQRDFLSRGRTRASIKNQFWATVEPMHARFVASQARWANLVFRHACGDKEISTIIAVLKRTGSAGILAGLTAPPKSQAS